MDLVEIRKKAKKLKDKKGGGKAPSSESALPVEEEIEASEAEAPVKGEKKPARGKKRKAEPVVDEQEDSSAYAGAIVGPEETERLEADDFLSSVLSSIYQEGYDEKDLEEVEDDQVELLCFMLSDEEYAVDIRDVREIIKVIEITEVPRMPSFILGIISLRGVIVPLLDLRMRLGLESGEYVSKTRIIIVSVERVSMGMVVDSVTEVVRLKQSVIEPPPTFLNNVDAELLEGVGRSDDRLLIMPNILKVFDLNS